MRKNAYPLTLDGAGFNAMKSDFNQCFNALIEKMISKESENGTIAIKLNITLNDGFAPDLDEVQYAADREIISPKLEHTITSTFQIKDKKSGFTGGDEYEIFWVREDGCWAMRKISDAQRSLFDQEEPAGEEASSEETGADDGTDDNADSLDYELPDSDEPEGEGDE